MKVNRINETPNTNQKLYKKAAIKGAAVTASALGLCTAYSSIKTPQDMRDVVLRNGGKNKYLMKYITGLAMISAIGSMLSLSTTFIASKINPKKEPKAV